jgi:hypothetical protein
MTKVELVALLDNLGLVELFAACLSLVTDRNEIKPLIYQESTSVITMLNKGGVVTRTKHMRTQLHLVLEASCICLSSPSLISASKSMVSSEFIYFNASITHSGTSALTNRR